MLSSGNLDEEEHQAHVTSKTEAREEKCRDKQDALEEKRHVFTVDLPAVKIVPCLKASALYYKQKLTVHNYTIFNIGNGRKRCYWFDESEANLVASTFAGYLVDYLEEILDAELKPVIIYSDGCGYQNKNRVMANALLHLSMKKNVTVTQKFSEKGHTQIEADSNHSCIEWKLKYRDMTLPSQYVAVTREAKLKPFPYETKEANHHFFKDYSSNETMIYPSIRPSRKSNDSTVSGLKVLKYKPDNN